MKRVLRKRKVLIITMSICAAWIMSWTAVNIISKKLANTAEDELKQSKKTRSDILDKINNLYQQKIDIENAKQLFEILPDNMRLGINPSITKTIEKITSTAKEYGATNFEVSISAPEKSSDATNALKDSSAIVKTSIINCKITTSTEEDMYRVLEYVTSSFSGYAATKQISIKKKEVTKELLQSIAKGGDKFLLSADVVLVWSYVEKVNNTQKTK